MVLDRRFGPLAGGMSDSRPVIFLHGLAAKQFVEADPMT